MLIGFQVAIPVQGWPTSTERICSSVLIVTVSHQSTVPVMMRFVVGSKPGVFHSVPPTGPGQNEPWPTANVPSAFSIVRDRHAVEQLVGGEIVAIEVAILRCHRHQLLAAHGLMQDRRAGHVPVVPVLLHDLEVVLVVARLGVEHDDRVGEEVVAFACARGEVGGRIASRDVQQAVLDIERVRGPGPAAADGDAGRVVPGLRVERRLAHRAPDDVAFDLGDEKELPDDLAGLSVERARA